MKSKVSISKKKAKVKKKVARKTTKNATKKKKKVGKKVGKIAKKVRKKAAKKRVAKKAVPKRSIPRNSSVRKKVSRRKSKKGKAAFTPDEEEILRLMIQGVYEKQLQELVVKKRVIRDEALAKRRAVKARRDAKRLVLKAMSPQDAEQIKMMTESLSGHQKRLGLKEEEFIYTRAGDFIYPSIMERNNHLSIRKRINHFANRVVALFNLGPEVEAAVRIRLGPFCDIALTTAEFIEHGLNEREYIEQQANALGKSATEMYTDIVSPPKWMLDELEDFELEHMYELDDAETT